MSIFSRMRRRREKPGIARLPDELSQRLQTEGDPLGTMCLLIMRLALLFFEQLQNQILTSGEDDRVKREMSVFLGLFSFYAHLMMSFATPRLTVVQPEYVQKQIAAIASEGVINYFYAECTEEAKAGLTTALTKNLNERITEYTEYANAIGGTHGASTEGFTDLLSGAGSELAKACGRPGDAEAIKVITEHLFIGYMIIVEAVRLDDLLLEIERSLSV
ncbi:MAG TPA: hypothetical protein VNO24_25555 [Blastocatellia bacterium]|nr:hypothetical protein [Blastocatellia bacterium]